MNKAVKTTLAITASLATIAGVVATPSMVSAWGNSGSTLRPGYTMQQINDGVLGDSIVFNSITDSVIGDERNFVAARLNDGNHGQDNVWSANDITVEHGKEYIIRLYVHNNSPKGMDAVSLNTRVGISIPQISATEVQVNGHIYSDNSVYNDYYDYVNFKADVPFHLEYIEGSAQLDNNGVGKDGGYKLSDNVVYKAASEHGVAISYSGAYADGTLDGEVPGCYSYSGYVTVRVKVVYDTDYTVTQQVRLVGSSEWSDSVDAKVGDKVEFWIQYRNTSDATQSDVMIRDVLPTSLRYVAGTTKLWNDHLNGAVNNENTIATTGINIGNYGPNANAHVRFQAEVVEDGLACGNNVLGNWSQASANGSTIQTATVVNVQNGVCENKDEEKPNTLPNTGPEAVAGGVIAAGSIATAAGYYIVSRRSLR